MKKLLFTAVALIAVNILSAQSAYTEKYPNGTKQCEGTYSSAITINDNDTKEVRAQKLANAIKMGKWQYWAENGQLIAEQYYTNGVMSGTWNSWYRSGKQESVINFTTGVTTTWYENGNVFESGKTLPGMIKEGVWVGNYESGKKNYEGSYKNGQKDGVWNWYNEQTGQVYFTEKWNNGTKVN